MQDDQMPFPKTNYRNILENPVKDLMQQYTTDGRQSAKKESKLNKYAVHTNDNSFHYDNVAKIDTKLTPDFVWLFSDIGVLGFFPLSEIVAITRIM